MRIASYPVILVLLATIMSSAYARAPDRNLVPTSDVAISLVKVILTAANGKAWVDKLLLTNDLKAESEDRSWVVFFYPKDAGKTYVDKNGNEMITVVAGGGLPDITISKRDAQVTNFSYSR